MPQRLVVLILCKTSPKDTPVPEGTTRGGDRIEGREQRQDVRGTCCILQRKA
jgi:hypothetical protein